MATKTGLTENIFAWCEMRKKYPATSISGLRVLTFYIKKIYLLQSRSKNTRLNSQVNVIKAENAASAPHPAEPAALTNTSER